MTISFDNASNNGSAIERLKRELLLILDGQLFHNRYACHILNLCVHDDLQVYNKALVKISGVLTLIQNNESRSWEWKQFVNRFGKSYKRFSTCVQIR